MTGVLAVIGLISIIVCGAALITGTVVLVVTVISSAGEISELWSRYWRVDDRLREIEARRKRKP